MLTLVKLIVPVGNSCSKGGACRYAQCQKEFNSFTSPVDATQAEIQPAGTFAQHYFEPSN